MLALKISGIFKVLFLLVAAATSGFSYSSTVQTEYSGVTIKYYCPSGCTANNTLATATSSTSLVCATYAAQWGGVNSHFTTYYGSPACGANHTNGTVNYWIANISTTNGCPDGFSSNPGGSGATACKKETVVQDCSDKIGQSAEYLMTCYSMQCPGGWTADGTTKISCPSGYTFQEQLVPQQITIAGCPAYLSRKELGKVKIPGSAIGTTQPQDGLCQIQYTVSGESPSPTNPPPNPPPQPDPASLKDPGAGTGAASGGTAAAAGSASGTGGSGTDSGLTKDGNKTDTPCIPTTTNPCTGSSGIECVPTATNPCTSTATGSGKCVPTFERPCSPSGGSTTGACSVSPVCTGDGVQCAQVIQTWKSVCELNKNMSEIPQELTDKLNAIKTASEATSDSETNDKSSLLGSHISDFQTAFNSAPSGSCLSDKTINVLNASIVIPLSELCAFLTFIKLLLHLGIDLLALMIISRAVNGNGG